MRGSDSPEGLEHGKGTPDSTNMLRTLVGDAASRPPQADVMEGNTGKKIAGHTFATMFADLKIQRDAHFKGLTNCEGLTLAEQAEAKMAPIFNDVVFDMPHSEWGFHGCYPTLEQLGQEGGNHPSIHFGIAGTRNFSIIAATRADAAILVDLNLNLVKTMDAIIDVGKRLIAERGIGNFGPVDFVEKFNEHPIQNLLKTVREFTPNQQTDLAQELVVPESWLYKGQEDGRFNHVMRLIDGGKIGTLGLNLADTKGFEAVALTLEQCKQQFPELKDAKIGTVFLSNALWHMAQPNSYYLYTERTGETDHTPRNAVTHVWDNVAMLAPNNPYVIYANGHGMDLLTQEPRNPIFRNPDIIGPTEAECRAMLSHREPSPDGHIGNDGVSYYKWLQMRLGGSPSVAPMTDGRYPPHHDDCFLNSNFAQMGRLNVVRAEVPTELPRMLV